MSETMQARKLAVSRAGHDKGTVYVVLREEADRVFIADGKLKTISRPKAKNPRHLQMIIHLKEDLLTQMAGIREDSDIRRILRQYRSYTERTHE